MTAVTKNVPICPENPVIYEINTWIWLNELSKKYSKKITLSNIPGNEWDELVRSGFDAIWLMGVWERSPAGSLVLAPRLPCSPGRRSILETRSTRRGP